MKTSLNFVLCEPPLRISLSKGKSSSIKTSVCVQMVECGGNLHSISGADAQEACLKKVEKH